MIILENIAEFVGRIPEGHELVIFEAGQEETAMSLFGFDEIGAFDHMFEQPQYGFLPF